MMVKSSVKEAKETEKQKLLNRENRTSGSSSSGSKSSSGSAGKSDGNSDRLNNVEMTMSVLMATIDQIMRRLEKIDLSKVGGGAGAPASSMGPSEHGGLHFPKSLLGDDTEDGDDDADAAYSRRVEKTPKMKDEEVVKEPKRRNTFSSFSAKPENTEDDEEDKMDDDEPIKVILVESDAWMINPTKKFRMTWDLCLIMPFLVYLTVMMPFRLCFANEARFGTGLYWFEFMIDIIFIMDIFTNFRTGVFVGRDGDGDTVEYDRLVVAKQYLKSWFVLDVVSGIPFALIELIFPTDGTNGSSGVFKAMKALKLLRFLKLGRLLKLSKILGNLDRDTLDKIEDFMQGGGTRSMMVFAKLMCALAYACHILACGYVLIGRYGYTNFDDEMFADTNGGGTWLAKENLGPWKARDTAGLTEEKDLAVLTIYIAAFYFALTTMTSVGYGDILPFNNVERAYCIVLEFIGAIIFAMVIAQISAVVSTMDTNARKTAEQLDAVTSFVEMRKFPDRLGRRIRRHFRHFYSLKSAIDEVKIFGEMSQTLRRTVSAFLVSDLMGSDSFFSSMPPMLWPKLLPLLRPMRFEATEPVAVQGEECHDVLIVLTGSMTGEMVTTPETKTAKAKTSIRHIVTGDCVNVLSAMGIWTRCVESVYADGNVETYACFTAEFRGLFTSSTDVDAFEQMQRAEAKNFVMDPSFEGTPFGKPLRYGCFSTVQAKISQASGLGNFTQATYKRSKANQDGETSENLAWVVIDLVDKAISKPFSQVLWRHQTARVVYRNAEGNPKDPEYTGEVEKPKWSEKFKWEDIKARFDRQALRVRVYTSNGDGQDQLVGKAMIDVQQVERESSKDVLGYVDGWYELDTKKVKASHANRSMVLQSDDCAKRMDGDLMSEHGCYIQLKLKVEPPEIEPPPKKKDLAWRIAQEKLIQGKIGAEDIAEVQMLRAQSLTQKKIELI